MKLNQEQLIYLHNLINKDVKSTSPLAREFQFKNKLLKNIKALYNTDTEIQVSTPDKPIKEALVNTVKEIRKKEDLFATQADFCNQHNFKLEETLNRKIEDELRRICHLIQKKFDLGYINSH